MAIDKDNKNFFLRNVWYFALPSSQIASGKTIAKTLLGEPIVFGRTHAGRVFALRDICPHRAVPLSCGRFDGQEVECGYHGWRFAANGQCRAIPSLTADRQLDLGRFGVKSYPVEEYQGNIWIYMSASDRDRASNPKIDIPKVPGFGDRPYQAIVTSRFPCFIDHAVVGLMDPTHVPFVHRAWWWRSHDNLSEEIKTFDPSPYGFTMRRHRLWQQTFFYRLLGKDPEVEISFQLPGVRVEQVTTKQHTLSNLTVITPISETETQVTTSFYCTMPWFTPLKPLLLPFVREFLNQDREMVANQQLRLQYDPPLMLIDDADTQARWYYKLKKEFARATAENRPFVNPVKEQVLRWRS